MANETPIPLDAADFLTTYADHFATKTNTKANGTPAGAIPTDQIRRYFTAEFGNLIDDMVLELRARALGAVRSNFDAVGLDETESYSVLDFVGGRVHVRNAGNSGYLPIQADGLFLANGVWIGSGSGDPNGSQTRARGSVYTDAGTGEVYAKTTTVGAAGWVPVGNSPLVDSFGWSGSTISAYYIPFASKIVEQSPITTQHLYRCPIDGTLNRVVLLCSGDPGSTDFDVMAPDGTTSLASQTSVIASEVPYGAASTAYELDFDDLGVNVSAGQYLSMLLNVTTSAAEVTGWLVIDP